MSRSYAPVTLEIKKAILLSGVTTLFSLSHEIGPGGLLLAPVFAVEIAKDGKKHGDTDEAIALEIKTARDDGTLQHATEFFDAMGGEAASTEVVRSWTGKGGRR